MRNSKPRKYTLEIIQAEALKYETRGDFQTFSRGAYVAAHKKDLLDQVCSHMGGRASGEKNRNFKWTNEKLKEEALKYKSVKDFVDNSKSAYMTARSRGLLDEICSHMSRLIGKDWTLESLEQEALKYKTRGEFAAKGKGAYLAARRKKLLNKICSHMGKPCGTSKPEQDLFDIIKSIFPKTQKFRDSKVRIDGKPHIQGFDLDIYIPELRKAIEFDGTYHHSFEGLKRARPWWPDEDIGNYHLLKDEHFNKKNIQVLHIQEENWKSNKQDCINQALKFLGV